MTIIVCIAIAVGFTLAWIIGLGGGFDWRVAWHWTFFLPWFVALAAAVLEVGARAEELAARSWRGNAKRVAGRDVPLPAGVTRTGALAEPVSHSEEAWGHR